MGFVWALGGIPSSVPSSDDRGPLSKRGVVVEDGAAPLLEELPRFMRFICWSTAILMASDMPSVCAGAGTLLWLPL